MPDLESASPETGVAATAPPGAYSRSTRLARAIALPLSLALLAVLLVFFVLFHPVRVDGPSMLPTLKSGDGVLTTKGYRDPQRGDIVSAEIRGQDGRPDEVIKRVVALPGDTVEIWDDVVLVNGQPESTQRVGRAPGGGDSRPPATVPAGHIYLMGDNRPVSFDSRFVGPVPLSKVHGRAVFAYMPVNRVRMIPRTP